MIISTEFQNLSILDQYFKLAHGYLEGSIKLCEAMIKGDYALEYSNSRVVLHLCRQAVELYLKGAIYAATNTHPKLGHRLDKLFVKYRELLPEAQFYFDIPFGFENANVPEEVITRFHETLDQRYRYPNDVKGVSFSGLEGFIPTLYITELKKLSMFFINIELEIKKRFEMYTINASDLKT